MVWTKLAATLGLLCLSVSAGGCASPGAMDDESSVAVAMTIDPTEWTDTQLVSIFHAADRWNTLGGHQLVQLTVVDGPRARHHIRPATLPEHYSGMHSPALDTIRIDVSQAEDNFETVVVHELGHAMGMEHIPVAGIMYTVVDGSIRDFTAADRGECERVGWCGETLAR